MLPDVINSTGLALDIGGVILLFIYGLPAEVRKEQIIYWGEGKEQVEKWKHYKKLSNLGLILLVIGFLLQLVSNWI